MNNKIKDLTSDKTNNHKEKVYAFWNGKNANGSEQVGSEQLIPKLRNTETLAKYDVSDETDISDTNTTSS